ncbi:MAG: PIN domain-containing protein, partial [Nanoarchaeota archaeon]|nr:PIN domain-containing protein [Nanoarchaeota archaeon]
MNIVLDSNEYIFFLHKNNNALNKIISDHDIIIHINETIVMEVLRNLDEKLKKDFYTLLLKNNFVLFHNKLPISLYYKYRDKGLKKGDILIGAFCEHINAKFLITENRHFLKKKLFEKVRIVEIDEFVEKYM